MARTRQARGAPGCGATRAVGVLALAATLLVWPVAAFGADDYDPLEGMDADGRIPKVDKSSYVSNPDRWRYLPESRIPPGNVFDRFLVSSILFPIVFFNSDVGAGFGAGIADIDFRKQRRREFLEKMVEFVKRFVAAVGLGLNVVWLIASAFASSSSSTHSCTVLCAGRLESPR